MNYQYHILTLIILVARIEPVKVFHNKNQWMTKAAFSQLAEAEGGILKKISPSAEYLSQMFIKNVNP